jgi:hypothetical protein
MLYKLLEKVLVSEMNYIENKIYQKMVEFEIFYKKA